MNLFRTITIASALVLFVGSSAAAERSCRIIYPDRPQGAPRSAYLFDGKQSREVTLPNMNLSELIELPSGDLAIALCEEEITDPKQIPASALILNIPKKIKDFYIIVGHDPDRAGLPIRLNLVDAGKQTLKPGETLWFNFTPHQITAMLGNSNLTIAPSKKAVSGNPIPESGYYAARFAYKVNGSGTFNAITAQMWWHDADSRHLGFVMDSGGKLPKIFFYRDYRDPDPVGDSAAQPLDQ